MSKITPFHRIKCMRKGVITMKRIGSLFVLLLLLLTIPAYAVSPRLVDVMPNISFANNNATCTVEIYADKSSDRISAVMELWQGNQKISSWSSSSTGYLSITKTTRVTAKKTYKLVVDYSINGVSKTPVTIYRTND